MVEEQAASVGGAPTTTGLVWFFLCEIDPDFARAEKRKQWEKDGWIPREDLLW